MRLFLLLFLFISCSKDPVLTNPSEEEKAPETITRNAPKTNPGDATKGGSATRKRINNKGKRFYNLCLRKDLVKLASQFISRQLQRGLIEENVRFVNKKLLGLSCSQFIPDLKSSLAIEKLRVSKNRKSCANHEDKITFLANETCIKEIRRKFNVSIEEIELDPKVISRKVRLFPSRKH